MRCITCQWWEATIGDQCETCAMPPPPSDSAVYGTISDFGGGLLHVVVDRDTKRYIGTGRRVMVVPLP